MLDAQPVSVHEICVEGDLVTLYSCGLTTIEDTKRIFMATTAVYERYGYALLLIDSSGGASATPEARRYQSDRLRQRIFPSHTAIYGFSTLSRAAIILMTRATELLTGTKLPVDMVADEQTARKILNEARERFRAQGIAKR